MEDRLRQTVGYDWCIEETDEYGDIIDHNVRSSLADFGPADTLDATHQLVLIRDKGSDANGLQDRQWAYVENGKLPAEFDGGAKVPERFVAELAKSRFA